MNQETLSTITKHSKISRCGDIYVVETTSKEMSFGLIARQGATFLKRKLDEAVVNAEQMDARLEWWLWATEYGPWNAKRSVVEVRYSFWRPLSLYEVQEYEKRQRWDRWRQDTSSAQGRYANSCKKIKRLEEVLEAASIEGVDMLEVVETSPKWVTLKEKIGSEVSELQAEYETLKQSEPQKGNTSIVQGWITSWYWSQILPNNALREQFVSVIPHDVNPELLQTKVVA